MLAASCSDAQEAPAPSGEETETTTPVTIAPATTVGVVVDTTSAVSESEPTTATTEPFPDREILIYLEDLQAVAVRIGQLVLGMRSANNAWDNRSETGATYEGTEAALEDVERRILSVRDDIALIGSPPDRGLPVEHQTAWIAVGQMADAAVDALAGLRSPDTGERRRAAVAEFVLAYERFNGAFGRIVDIIGVGATISLPTVGTTVAVTTATTSATTATTEAASTTSTTVADGATSTTEAASTTSTTVADGADTGTLPPKPDIGYEQLDEVESSFRGALRVWVTVQVDAGATKSQLAQIANRVAFENRVANEYQALLINFVHFPENTDTLGSWVHAPFGAWERAAEAEKGDYSQHQVSDRTVEKDWDSLPGDAQVDLYRRYRQYVDDQEDQSQPEDQLITRAAEDLGVTESELRAAIAAWDAWREG